MVYFYQMRFGLITPSYGRLIAFLSAVYFLRPDSSKLNLNILEKLDKTFWIFPSEAQYPITSSLLRREIRILPPKFLKLYKFLTRFESVFGAFVASQDDLNHLTTQSWSHDFNILDHICLPHASSSLVQSALANGVDLRNFYIINTRDSDWDLLSRQSREYVATQDFRNSNLDDYREFVHLIISMGSSVIRTGRSLTPLFLNPVKGFLDYASETIVSEENDYFLWSNSKKAIVTLNGGCNLGFLFKKPMLIWDYPESLESLSDTVELYPINHLYLVRRHALLSLNSFSRFDLLTRALSAFVSFQTPMKTELFSQKSGPIRYF